MDCIPIPPPLFLAICHSLFKNKKLNSIMNRDWVFQKCTIEQFVLILLSASPPIMQPFHSGGKKSQGSFLDSGDTEEVYKQVGWEQTFP